MCQTAVTHQLASTVNVSRIGVTLDAALSIIGVTHVQSLMLHIMRVRKSCLRRIANPHWSIYR